MVYSSLNGHLPYLLKVAYNFFETFAKSILTQKSTLLTRNFKYMRYAERYKCPPSEQYKY
jgi:hypothetical protein